MSAFIKVSMNGWLRLYLCSFNQVVRCPHAWPTQQALHSGQTML